MKSWNKTQIENHKIAGKKLALIKDEFHSHILSNVRMKKEITEKECVDFIKKSYKKHGLVNDHKKEFAIVAFGPNTKEVHHFISTTTTHHLKPNTLILLDIWARLDQQNAPYADATFMFYVGKKVPEKIQKTWEVLISARDSAIGYIKKEIKKGKFPRGLDIDRVTHDTIGKAGLGNGIKHTIGHSLGFDSPHGKLPGINWREYSPILPNVGYTIEPGIYLENFGMRSEIDFYIDDQKRCIITTPVQKDIEIIQ